MMRKRVKAITKIGLQQPTIDRQAFLFMQLSTGTLLLLIIKYVYFNLPYYQSYLLPNYRTAIELTFWILLLTIWIDALIKFLFIKKIRNTKFMLIFILVYSIIFHLLYKSGLSSNKVEIKWDHEIKTAILSTLVKAFYIPIMIAFTISPLERLIKDVQAVEKGLLKLTFENTYYMVLVSIFLIDTSLYLFGYMFESVWLRSEIKSVEPTLLGWVAALSTYPPFNSLTGQISPMASGSDIMLANQSEMFRHSIMLMIFVFDIIFVSASVALFTKASNLTNRGIVSRGPYRFVRHPAYAAKLIAWALADILAGISKQYFVFWLAFVFIYGLRAWTEERHLSQDPDYIAYKKKVRYKVLPGII